MIVETRGVLEWANVYRRCAQMVRDGATWGEMHPILARLDETINQRSWKKSRAEGLASSKNETRADIPGARSPHGPRKKNCKRAAGGSGKGIRPVGRVRGLDSNLLKAVRGAGKKRPRWSNNRGPSKAHGTWEVNGKGNDCFEGFS